MLRGILCIVLGKNTQVLQNHRIQVTNVNVTWQVWICQASVNTLLAESGALRS